MPTDISFQRIHRLSVEQIVYLLEKLRVGYVQLGKSRRANAGEITIQQKIGGHRHRILFGHLVVAILGIAALGAVHRGFRECRLNAQHSLGSIG